MEIRLSFENVLKILSKADGINLDGEMVRNAMIMDEVSQFKLESGKVLKFKKEDNHSSLIAGGIIFLTTSEGDCVSCSFYEMVGDKYFYPKTITI